MDERIISAVKQVLALLVNEQYDEMQSLSRGVRLSAQEMRGAIDQYGRHLIMGPAEQLQEMDVVEVRMATPKRWSIQVPLWTREEGRSDLTLELTLIDSSSSLNVEIDDIHVL